jgi:hypothetical protein
VAAVSAAGLEMLLGEAAKGPDLVVAALTNALPKGPLYCHAKEDEEAYPKSHKNRLNHNKAIHQQQ